MTTTSAATFRERPGAGSRQGPWAVGFAGPCSPAEVLSSASAKMEPLAAGRGLFWAWLSGSSCARPWWTVTRGLPVAVPPSSGRPGPTPVGSLQPSRLPQDMDDLPQAPNPEQSRHGPGPQVSLPLGPVRTCRGLGRLPLCVSTAGVGWPPGGPWSLGGRALAEEGAGVRDQVPAAPSAQAAPEGRALSSRGPGREGNSREFQSYPCPYLGPFSVPPSVCGRAAQHPGAPSSSCEHCTGATARAPRSPPQGGLEPPAPGAEAGGVGLSALRQKKRAMF